MKEVNDVPSNEVTIEFHVNDVRNFAGSQENERLDGMRSSGSCFCIIMVHLAVTTSSGSFSTSRKEASYFSLVVKVSTVEPVRWYVRLMWCACMVGRSERLTVRLCRCCVAVDEEETQQVAIDGSVLVRR